MRAFFFLHFYAILQLYKPYAPRLHTKANLCCSLGLYIYTSKYRPEPGNPLPDLAGTIMGTIYELIFDRPQERGGTSRVVFPNKRTTSAKI